MNAQAILEGAISIQAAIEAKSRPIECLILQQYKQNRQIGYLKRLATAENIPIEERSADAIDVLTNGQSHGGVVALVGPRTFHPIEELATGVASPFLVMLDGIEDPFNFGYAVRAIYAAGAHGLILRTRNWFSATSTVARASAGTSERIPTAIVETAEDGAAVLRHHGIQVACTAFQGATELYEANLTVPLFLVIGGEKRGITRSFVDSADILLRIPYGRDFSLSMGTAAATAVLTFEVMRQRMGEHE
ncbi:MAG: RNA methyltransferase [Chloroflexota bacterium]